MATTPNDVIPLLLPDAALARARAGKGYWESVWGRLRDDKVTIAVTLMNACTMFAWWGFNLWLPGYLSLPPSEGGIGLSTSAMSGFVVAMLAYRLREPSRRTACRSPS